MVDGKVRTMGKTEEDKIHKPLKKKIQLNVHSAEQPANNGGQLTSDAGQPAKKKKKKKGSIVDNDAVANSMSAQLSASSSNVQMAKKQGQKGHRPAAPYSFKECVHKSKTSVQIVAGNPDGDTILHSAAGMGYPGVFSKLINKEGAKIDIKNNSGKTALHVATIHGHKTIVRLLIEKGAQVDIQDSNGATALHYATTNGYINIASLLIKKGAQIDIPENEGFTALHYAALKGLTGIVRALIKKEAQIGINNLGCTALHYAAYLGHTDIAHELINAGAKKDIKNCEGKTALQCATEKGYREIVNLLGGADQQSVSKKKKKKKKKKNKNKASSATPVASGAKVVPDEAAAEEVKTSLFAASAANFPENSGQTNNPHAFFQQHQHSDDNQQAMQFCFDEKFNDDSQQGMQH